VPDGRLYRFLIRFADIRPNEARQALGFFFYFFLITLSIYVIKPVKENFLIGITPAWWPYADFVTAALIGFVITINDGFVRRLPRKAYSEPDFSMDYFRSQTL
jgi:ATP/ADP translocase